MLVVTGMTPACVMRASVASRRHLAHVARGVHDRVDLVAVGLGLQRGEGDAHAGPHAGHDERLPAGRLHGLDEVLVVPRADLALARDVLGARRGRGEFLHQRAVGAAGLGRGGDDRRLGQLGDLREHDGVRAQVPERDVLDRLEQAGLVVEQQDDRVVRIEQHLAGGLTGLPGDARYRRGRLRRPRCLPRLLGEGGVPACRYHDHGDCDQSENRKNNPSDHTVCLERSHSTSPCKKFRRGCPVSRCFRLKTG